MIEFIYGVTGSGKTTALYGRVRESLKKGNYATVIVPDQEALEAEAALAGLCRDIPTTKLRVYGFSRLSNEVFRKYGGISYELVNRSGQKLALFLALCSVSPSLSVYGTVSPSEMSLLSSLSSAIKELKQQGVGIAELELAAKQTSDPALAKKLSDLCLIMPAYEKIIRECGDDPDDELGRMYRVLSEHGGMSGTDVFIDSFVDFTGTQLKLTELFMRTADNVTVTLGIPGPSHTYGMPGLLSPLYDTDRRLRAQAQRYGGYSAYILGEPHHLPCMVSLEKALRTGKLDTNAPCDGIRIFREADIYAEAEAIAADIRKKLANGVRCRDIAIFTHSPERLSGILDAALEQYGIPYFLSVAEDIRQTPFFRTVMSALSVCCGGFKLNDICTYIKTGLLDADPYKLDLFDDYITRRQISGLDSYLREFEGSPDSYGAPTDEHSMRKLILINEAREAVITPLYDLHNSLLDSRDAKSISSALLAHLQAAGVPKKLTDMMLKAKAEGDSDDATRLSRLWSAFVFATEQLCTVCGSLEMNASLYSRLLDNVLSETELGRIPTSVDQVTVGDSGMLRIHSVSHVYMIGCNEGDFPAAVPEQTIFNDADRAALAESGIELNGTTELGNERRCYDFYRCAVSAAKTVTFTYSINSVFGEEKNPCHILNDIQRYFPDIKIKSGTDMFDKAGSDEALLEYYAENRNQRGLYEIKKLISEDTDGQRRLSALSLPLVIKKDFLSEKTARLLMPGAIRLSPSRLKTFTGCPAAHAFKYFLGLNDGGKITFNNAEFGTFVHYILKRLIDELMQDGALYDADEKQLEKKLGVFIDDYCRQLLHIDPDGPGLGRLKATVRRLKKSSLKACRDVIDELAEGKFKPAATELVISEKNGMPPYMLDLSNGGTTYLTGIIDRVDTYEENGKTYIKLVDYKTKNMKFSPANLAEAGDDVQLFVYMLTVCNKNGKFKDPVPAAVFYMNVTAEEGKMTGSGDDIPDKLPLKRGGIALSDTAVTSALEPGLDTARGGKIYKTRSEHMTFVSSEELDAVFEEVKGAVADAALRICSGDSSVTEKGGESSACKHCGYVSVCRYTRFKGR